MRDFSRRLVLVFLVFLLIIGLAGCNNRDATNPKYFNFNSSSGSITGIRTDIISDIVISSVIDGVAVQEIGAAAFKGANLTLIDIPDSVSVIRRQAFAVNDLTSVDVPFQAKCQYFTDSKTCTFQPSHG